MKKMLKKSFLLTIILLYIMQYILPIVSLSTSKKINSYIALGDSIAYGYGLSDMDSQSYASLVSKHYNVSSQNYQNLAVSGMTCKEFYTAIKQSNYTNAISKADLITISIGSNELLELVIGVASETTGIPAYNNPNFVQDVQTYIANLTMLKKLQLLQQFYKNLTSETTRAKIEQAISEYNDYWLRSVEYIKSKNPQAVIVATEFYNPYYEVALGSYDMGGFVDEFIQNMNNILWQQSQSETKYKIAKIYDAFNSTDPRITNVNISLANINKFNVDPHPNANGHEIIYTKIIDALANVATNKTNIASLKINDIKDQKYTSEKIEPEIKITNGDTILEKGTDYTVSYINNINVGQADALITGIGNYEGTVTKTFNIIETSEQVDISKLTLKDIPEQTYIGIAIEPDVEILDKTKKLLKNVDYKLQYQNNINVGTASLIIKGIGNYNGEIISSFKINQKNLEESMVSEINNQIYTGQSITPTVHIVDGSTKLQEDIDYTLNYANNIDEGIASVTISGINNYTNAVTKTFNIIKDTPNPSTQKDINTLQITEIGDKIYTGKLITPEIKIVDGEKILAKDIDYKINYENNLNIGTGIATIIGIGDYKGKIERNFNILPKDISFTYIVDIKDQIYNNQPIEPKIVILSDGIILKENTDYSIKYINNVNPGVATIIIAGQGNYKGETLKTFNIVKQEINTDNNTPNNENEISNISNNQDTYNSKIDNTLSQKFLPKTGIIGYLIKIILFGFLIILGIYFYITYKKKTF